MLTKRPALVLAAAVLSAASLALTGCASNSEGGAPAAASSTVSVSKAPDLSSLVPADIKSKGVLTIGINTPYAPNEYKDSSGKIVGFDVDLMNAVAGKLGLKTSYVEADFDNIIPGIGGGKYDVGVSSFTDNKEREKTVDFVDYFTAGTQWADPAGKTVDPDNACGLKVAVQTTTVQDTDDIPARSKACTGAGKKAISKVQYTSQDAATNAVVLGKVDAMAADSPITAYAVKQSGGKIALAGKIYDAAPYGYALKKGGELVTPIQKALQALMDDGTYKMICAQWGNDGGEISSATVNGATS